MYAGICRCIRRHPADNHEPATSCLLLLRKKDRLARRNAIRADVQGHDLGPGIVALGMNEPPHCRDEDGPHKNDAVPVHQVELDGVHEGEAVEDVEEGNEEDREEVDGEAGLAEVEGALGEVLATRGEVGDEGDGWESLAFVGAPGNPGGSYRMRQ
jgi:hypothetical protein